MGGRLTIVSLILFAKPQVLGGLDQWSWLGRVVW